LAAAPAAPNVSSRCGQCANRHAEPIACGGDFARAPLAGPVGTLYCDQTAMCRNKGSVMGINTERDIEANLQIGPTSEGMVRLFVEGAGIEIPMDFDPGEAEEIAEELRAAAARARAMKTRRKNG